MSNINEEQLLKLIDESFEVQPQGKVLEVNKREVSKAYKTSGKRFVRKIQGTKDGRLFIYLANAKLMEKLGFSKGDLVKIIIEDNRIIIEKI